MTHAPQPATGSSETRNKPRSIPYLCLSSAATAPWFCKRPATQPVSLETIRASEVRIQFLNQDCQEFMLCFALSIAQRNGLHG